MTLPPTEGNGDGNNVARTNSMSLTGRTLGQFDILEEIGRGGMATVYRARQKKINRIVAIKVLPPALLHDPSFYERFAREVDVIAHLEHPHILPIYDYGEEEGVPYIAMRYLAGGSMAQMLRRGLPPLASLLRPLTQIGQALDHAHQQGIIHRDLKPGNILLDENGNAYLTDFGIARVLNSSLTGSALIGTPAYMSPEQANGTPLDARSDVYALGVVLFELITGREPFEAETPVAMLLKHINEPMPSARQLRPSLPEAVDEVIYRATAKQVDERYPSAGEMAAAFTDAIGGTGLRLGQSVREDQPTLVPGAEGGTPLRLTPMPGGTPLSPIRTKGALTPPPALTPPMRASARPLSSDVDAVGTIVLEDTLSRTNARGSEISSDERARRSRVPLIVGALILVTGVVAVILLAPVIFSPSPIQPTSMMRTPFTAAQVRFSQEEDFSYSITIPNGFEFAELTSDEGVIHIWRRGLEAYIGLIVRHPRPLPNINDANTDAERLHAAMDDYARTHYPPDAFRLIDEVTTNSTVRRSYRLEGIIDPPFPYGQTDAFFHLAGERLIVLELYTADEQDESSSDVLVPIFQQVLESLEIQFDNGVRLS